MLRQPGSRYEPGRSATLLKVTRFHDAEARVIDHQPGAGRHKGRMGALLVALPDGTEFSVGTGFTDTQRNNPPLVGSTMCPSGNRAISLNANRARGLVRT